MKDFVIKFKNLKLLAKISRDHAMKILQSNVNWEMIKQFILLYRPPANYNVWRQISLNLEKLKTISRQSITLPSIHPSILMVLLHQTPAQQLPQGTTIDVNYQQCPGTSHPLITFRGNCYDCSQSGHLTEDCLTPCPCWHSVHIAPPSLDNEASYLKEEIKQIQCNLAAFERSKTKEKDKEEKPVQMLPQIMSS